MSVVVERIKERVVPNHRLGRHIEHDNRSRTYSLVQRIVPIASKTWTRHGPIFTQNEGSCTGQTMAGVLMTKPFYQPGRELDENDALELYKRATHLDHVPGEYPPDDTGSTGLAVAKAAKEKGYITLYRHAFGFSDVLHALQTGPVMLGTTWYDSFDSPEGVDARLVITEEAEPRGGHEVEILALDIEKRVVRGVNSWGDKWGDKGYFTIDYRTLKILLKDQGDVVVPIG